MINKILRAQFSKFFGKKPSFRDPILPTTSFRDKKQYFPKLGIGEHKFDKIIQKCSNKNKDFMWSLVNTKMGGYEAKKLSQRLVSIADFTTRQNFSAYQMAVITILLKNCQNTTIRNFKNRTLNLFLHYSDQQGNDQLVREGRTDFNDVRIGELDSQLLEYIFLEISIQFVDALHKQKQKNKKNKFKIRLLNLIQTFLPKIESVIGLKEMLKLMRQLTDQLTMITKFRVSKAVGAIEAKIKDLIEYIPELTENVRTNNKIRNNNPKFSVSDYYNLLKSMQYCDYQQSESIKYFLNVIASDKFMHPDTSVEDSFKYYLMLYRTCYDFLDENGRNPLYQRVKYCYENDKFFQKVMNQNETAHVAMFISFCLKGTMPCKTIEECVVITQLTPLPKIDQFLIKIIRIHQKQIYDQFGSTYEFIRLCYPEILDGKGGEINQKAEMSETYTDNEIVARFCLLFDRLKMSYEKEAFILGRSCDFLIKGNIMFECDGDMHLNYRNLDVSAKTAWRNVIGMYCGYRILVIGLHQFNNNRELDALQKLLQKKLRIMQEHKAFLVQ